MKIWEGTQNTKEWHDEFRAKGLGSSDVSAIIGMNAYKTPLEVYQDKLGLSFPQIDNDNMRHGRDCEPFVLLEFNRKYNANYKPVCAIHDSLDMDHVRGSFDGYDSSTNSILEIKASKYQKLTNCILKQDVEHLKETYPAYYSQVSWFMFIADAKEATIATFSHHDGSLISIKIPRDEKFIENMAIKATDFWFNNVLTNVPPETSILTLTTSEATAMASDLSIILEKIKVLKEREKDMRDSIIELGADDDFIVGNLKFTRTSRETVSYKKACEDAGIDLKSYTKPGIGYYRISKI